MYGQRHVIPAYPSAWRDEPYMANAAKRLFNEVRRRFPEVQQFLNKGDEKLPYVVVGYIVDWLRTVAKPLLDPSVIRRVVEFDNWCIAQPPGRSAEDDIMTIEIVALREKLFRYDELLPLIPHLMPRDELLLNEDYLVGWVGEDRYQAALRLTDQ